jgi:hypothetical protein
MCVVSFVFSRLSRRKPSEFLLSQASIHTVLPFKMRSFNTLFIFVVLTIVSTGVIWRLSITITDDIAFRYDVDDLLRDIGRSEIPLEKDFFGPAFEISSNGKTLIPLCKPLFLNELPSNHTRYNWPPPRKMDSKYFSAFTLNGRIPIHEWYLQEQQNGNKDADIWTTQMINNIASKPSTCGLYLKNHCQLAFRKYAQAFTGKRGVVFGSQSPWAEAAILGAGADHVTTVEYRSIICSHERHSALHPIEFAKRVLNDDFRPVDFVFSFSTFEHTGLGRYGDWINPHGDLEAIARVHCILKPGGYLFLGLPLGPDAVVWNGS